MPSVEEFKKNFNLVHGHQFGNWRIVSLSVEERTILRYQEYLFPITLVLEGVGDLDELNENLSSLEVPRTIYSKYGNPYECVIYDITIHPEKSYIVVNATGFAKRFY